MLEAQNIKVSDLLSLLLSMNQLTTIFVWVMAAIAVITLSFLLYHHSRFKSRITALNQLIERQDREELALNRKQILDSALEQPIPEVGKLWREFDESLVFSSDRQKLSNTLDAEHFFNEKTLATGLTESRLLAAAPSFLVAIGVLGTFVGLSLGLSGLDLNGPTSALKKDMATMISGAATAFNTSIVGVLLSLIINFIEKKLERQVRGVVLSLQQNIDFLYPRIPGEQSLVEISAASQNAADALMVLHEKIGERLQESIEGISQSMQEAVTEALNKVMAPAIDSLVRNASDQSTVALEQLVGQFLEKFGEAGRVQGAALDRVADNVTSAVSGMQAQLDRVFESLESGLANTETQVKRMSDAAAEREEKLKDNFSQIMSGLDHLFSEQSQRASEEDSKRHGRLSELLENMGGRQSDLLDQIGRATENNIKANDQLVESLTPISGKLSEVAEYMSLSSDNMKLAAHDLGELGRQARSASDALATSIRDAVQGADRLANGSANVADQISAQIQLLETIHAGIGELTGSLEESARNARDGFSKMEVAQGQFLDGVKAEFSRLGASLKEQVQSIESQAAQWLEDYQARVSSQVSDRMGKWDEVSRTYADQMLTIAQTISGIVDEIEAKR